MAQTLFDKLWAEHRVCDAGDGADLLAIDRLLLHERTGGVALKSLAENGYSVRDPSRVYAIMDHIVSFRAGRGRDESRSPGGEAFITETRQMAEAAGIHLIDTDSPAQGIVHVTAPEQGIVLPGYSIVCPDSHTCSLGAFGAMAWGIGSSEAEHVMATGVIRAKKPPQMRVSIDGELPAGCSAKDIALYVIAKYGAAGGKRCAIEYAGSTVADLSIEGRLTLCNMAVEFAAFSALIAPDEQIFSYARSRLADRSDVDKAMAHWRTLTTDDHAVFDYEIHVDACEITPQISWGTSPEESMPLGGHIPLTAPARALEYMGLSPAQPIAGLPIQGAFIGSCTNGRLSDLQAAATVLKGRRVASGVRAVCVPGSQQVRAEAEALGVDQVFIAAGFEWGEPGCAMCFYAGGETFPPGARVVSSTNRNFEGRQGPGVRTHITSPATVAACAVAGKICAPVNLPALEPEVV
ncbi:MAG: 3-isopropylmalate dehydratase large subunit [Henriciella sp.]|nr:3-isopropylmalate dehydratase large subunit [Henriciella sp.]